MSSLLTEYARQALGRAITAPHLEEGMRLRAITLDPAIEQEVATSITQTGEGEYLAMEPTRAQAIIAALRAQVENASARGVRPVLLCSARVRRHLRRLTAQAQPHLAGLLLQRDLTGHRRRDDRSDKRMSTATQTLPQAPEEQQLPVETAPQALPAGESPSGRLFRGRTVAELIPRIQAELGPEAIVLRRRSGLEGGVGGFFQRPFVEIEARPGSARIDLYDDGVQTPELPDFSALELAHIAEQPGQPDAGDFASALAAAGILDL